MRNLLRNGAAAAAIALGLELMPAIGIGLPAISHADEPCPIDTVWNAVLEQCVESPATPSAPALPPAPGTPGGLYGPGGLGGPGGPGGPPAPGELYGPFGPQSGAPGTPGGIGSPGQIGGIGGPGGFGGPSMASGHMGGMGRG
ncbi:hypothetical protein [Mycobacterium sp. 23]|uniref:hypothetical protein n=1 Tax=Mycobacterium sp. 23 TaxID=3400424 RepID=UPI003AAE9BCE